MLVAEKVPTVDEIKAALAGDADEIGSGAWRTVYRVPGSRWVIKVDTPEDYYDTDLGDNAAEYVAYLELKNSNLLTDRIKLPEMHFIGGYIVAEYIEGEHPVNSCWVGFHTELCPGTKDCWRTKFNDCGFDNPDLHSDNIKVTEDDVIYIIDLGGGVYIK